ncbi:hypothetical protein JCM6882_002122 [Rhodosporidiobolus microsporus]
MAVLPEPPVTPISSTASSFLSFSPEAPDTPSPSLYSPQTTPRAYRRRPSAPAFQVFGSNSPIKLEAPPQRRRAESVSTFDSGAASNIFGDCVDISPVTVDFASRNPFAAFVSAAPTSPSSSFSTSPADSSCPPDLSTNSPSASSLSSLSNASTPTQDSLDDDLVVYDGEFIGQDAAVVFQGFGVVNTGDLSSSWEDELYSSLSDTAPSSPTTSRPYYPSSPCKTPRVGSTSPRKGSRSAPSPRHPFRHSSPRHSPRPSAPGSPSASRSRSRAGTIPSTVPGSAQLDSGFQLCPTSPVYQQQREQAGRFPFSNLAPSPFIRFAPPRSRKSPSAAAKTSGGSSKKGVAAGTEDKAAARARRRQERLDREQAEDGRSQRRTQEGIDLDALDRFFGVTPKHAKALRGGYAGVAAAEGMVGSAAEEAERWRRVEEFRSLLDQGDATDEDGDVSSAADASEAEDNFLDSQRSTRRRPPPLTLAHSSHSRSASASSSLASPSPIKSLLSPVVLTPAPRSSSLPTPNPLSDEIRRREDAGAPVQRRDGSEGKGLKHKQSMGDRLRGLFVGGR